MQPRRSTRTRSALLARSNIPNGSQEDSILPGGQHCSGPGLPWLPAGDRIATTPYHGYGRGRPNRTPFFPFFLAIVDPFLGGFLFKLGFFHLKALSLIARILGPQATPTWTARAASAAETTVNVCNPNYPNRPVEKHAASLS
ncbi:hypothetical protein V2G26_015352 [Clonostachys chloroleuca]